MMHKSMVGKSIVRLEDEPLVRGEGRYLDDIVLDRMCSMVAVRSPYAHALFKVGDISAACQAPGVLGVYVAKDILPLIAKNRLEVALPTKAFYLDVQRPVLPENEVCYVGEVIAVVVAHSRAQAEDAAELLEIEFEPLDAVVDCKQALSPSSMRAHQSLEHNLVADFSFDYGSIDTAFSHGVITVHDNFFMHRGASHPMECRGVIAQFNPSDEKWTVWSSTQTPHPAKRLLTDILGVAEHQVRVVTPDLGGGFGPKLVFYPEEVLAPVVSRLLARPVKWVEDRREHCMASTQERDQHWYARLAVDQEGKILGVDGAMLHEHGAYTARGVNVAYGSGVTVPLPYNVPAYRMSCSLAMTNKVPVTPVRGAGQPQAVFVMERLLDAAARKLSMDRVEIRRRNLVRSDQMPCIKPLTLRGGRNVVLDSGDFIRSMDKALDVIDWQGFTHRQQLARQSGRYIGIGLANYVEGTGRGPYESVKVKLSESGKIYVTSGAAAMGQGTKTMLAQIVSNQLGVPPSDIFVTVGDTDSIDLGFGGFNSRQTVTAGSSAHSAARRLRAKIIKVASVLLNSDANALEMNGQCVFIKENPDQQVTLRSVAKEAVGLPGFLLPDSDGPSLEVLEHTIIDDMSYSNGSAVAEVEVDLETGLVRVLKFVIAHDCGTMVNPANVDGQITGGIAHGLGNALFEWMGFDSQAQPVSTTLADYLLITAAEMPRIEIVHDQSPSPFNELGLKGVGESGVVPTPAAIASAVEDALSPLGVRISSFPITPHHLRELIRNAQSRPVNQTIDDYHAMEPDWVKDVQSLRQSKHGTLYVK